MLIVQKKNLSILVVLVVVLVGTAQALLMADQDQPPRRLGSAVSATREQEVLPAYTGCGGVYGVPSSNPGFEQEVLERVNAVRADMGVPPLKLVAALEEAARYHAADLAQDRYFDHDSYDRSGAHLVRACSWSQRIQTYYANWSALAENIAAGYPTPDSVLDGWMNSPGHRANILSPHVWEIGLGYYQGGPYGHYWVQDFGRREGVYPLIVNRDARSTDSRTVSLYIYGDWQEMRLRNEGGLWTAWRPFQSTMTWDLPRQKGEHTVQAELRAGEASALASDTILLTQSFVPALGNLPDHLLFAYSIPDAQIVPGAHMVTPMNVGSAEPLQWSVSSVGTWFSTAPLTGTTPSSFSIRPTVFDTGTPATYSGEVIVTVTNPENAERSPHRIDLTLRVTDEPIARVYLPQVLRSYTPSADPARHPDDALYSSQWGMEKVDAPGAWSLSTGQGTTIAVLDTGVDLEHPDLAAKLLTDQDWDFVNGDATAQDDHGHGTHVAGIAAAATDNGVGVAGAGWDAMILPLKILTPTADGSATGTVEDMAVAISYAADHGADIINLSLGAPGVSCSADTDDAHWVRQAIDQAVQKGIVLVAAGGNDRYASEMFPANCEHILGVSATDRDDEIAAYSSRGTHVSVAAPGGTRSCASCAIYSTMVGGGYEWLQGTSMSTPHVAGLAALLMARYPTYTPDQVASAILDNAMDLGATGWDEIYGCGRIDAYASLSIGARAPEPLCLEDRTWRQVGGSPQGGQSLQQTPAFVPGEILVELRPGVTTKALLERHPGTAQRVPTLNAWRLTIPAGSERAVLAGLRNDSAVLHASLNYLVFAQ